MRLRALLLALTLALLALGAAGPALGATPQTSVTDVEDEVMCVACGVPLDIAESPQATQERSYIRQLVAEGKSKDEIKAELVAQYGQRVLATPKDSGFGLAAYLVPIALVLAALIAGAFFLPKWRAKRDPDDDETDPAQAPKLTDADARRLEEDLARYEV
jgi:cytochrome c-type biogenesis protein CcmH/NrfF